jgi:hypothetical protein
VNILANTVSKRAMERIHTKRKSALTHDRSFECRHASEPQRRFALHSLASVSTMIVTSVLTISLHEWLVRSATVYSRDIYIDFDVNQVENLTSQKRKSDRKWGTQFQNLVKLSTSFVSIFDDIAFYNSSTILPFRCTFRLLAPT